MQWDENSEESSSFVSSEDVRHLWPGMTEENSTYAAYLAPIVSDALREHARRAGKDLDEAILARPAYESVVKMVVVNILRRSLLAGNGSELFSQMSQTVGPFSVSGTYANPTRDVLVYQNDLKELGLKCQRYGAVDLYGDA